MYTGGTQPPPPNDRVQPPGGYPNVYANPPEQDPRHMGYFPDGGPRFGPAPPRADPGFYRGGPVSPDLAYRQGPPQGYVDAPVNAYPRVRTSFEEQMPPRFVHARQYPDMAEYGPEGSSMMQQYPGPQPELQGRWGRGPGGPYPHPDHEEDPSRSAKGGQAQVVINLSAYDNHKNGGDPAQRGNVTDVQQPPPSSPAMADGSRTSSKVDGVVPSVPPQESPAQSPKTPTLPAAPGNKGDKTDKPPQPAGLAPKGPPAGLFSKGPSKPRPQPQSKRQSQPPAKQAAKSPSPQPQRNTTNNTSLQDDSKVDGARPGTQGSSSGQPPGASNAPAPRGSGMNANTPQGPTDNVPAATDGQTPLRRTESLPYSQMYQSKLKPEDYGKKLTPGKKTGFVESARQMVIMWCCCGDLREPQHLNADEIGKANPPGAAPPAGPAPPGGPAPPPNQQQRQQQQQQQQHPRNPGQKRPRRQQPRNYNQDLEFDYGDFDNVNDDDYIADDDEYNDTGSNLSNESDEDFYRGSSGSDVDMGESYDPSLDEEDDEDEEGDRNEDEW